jgi:non-specific serine/threonine protein kinase
MGKTRLAIETASRVQDVFAEGVFFVPLASVGSINTVISTIANALHFAFHGPSDPKVQLLNYLREKQVLLIVDNVEHLLVGEPHQETVAELLVQILQRAAQVKLLVTSRESLGLQDEWVFEVEGLPVPETIDTSGSAQNTSVSCSCNARGGRMLVSLRPGISPIVRICEFVDGMPRRTRGLVNSLWRDRARSSAV